MMLKTCFKGVTLQKKEENSPFNKRFTTFAGVFNV